MRLEMTDKNRDSIISLANTKWYLGLNDNYDDDLVEMLIKSGLEVVENFIHQPILNETWKCEYDISEFCNSESQTKPYRIGSKIMIPITRTPLIEINEVFADDRRIDSEKYYTEKVGQNYWLVADDAENFDHANSITVSFDSGFATTPENVPNLFKLANYALVAHAYNDRNSGDMNIPTSVKACLSNYMKFGGI